MGFIFHVMFSSHLMPAKSYYEKQNILHILDYHILFAIHLQRHFCEKRWSELLGFIFSPAGFPTSLLGEESFLQCLSTSWTCTFISGKHTLRIFYFCGTSVNKKFGISCNFVIQTSKTQVLNLRPFAVKWLPV